MVTTTSCKSNQFLWLVLKLFIVIACSFFIVTRLTENKELNFSVFLAIIKENDVFLSKNLPFLIILSFFNWFFEILKWQKLASQVTPISFLSATKQSLATLTTSMITPNKIGEYGTKILYFQKSQRKRVLALNFIGNFYQLMITLFAGLIGFVILFDFFSDKIRLNEVLLISVTLLLCSSIFIILIKKVASFRIYYQKLSSFLGELTLNLHRSILSISLIRYLIFSHQYYFLLLSFGVDIGYNTTMAGIFCTYLLASIIPVLSLFDFVIKGSVAIVIFSLFEIDSVTMLSSSALMWIFNFALPAIIGSYFVLTLKSNSL